MANANNKTGRRTNDNKKAYSNKRSNNKAKCEEVKETREGTLTNNPAWYFANKEDMEMYTRLSDNIIAGRPIHNWSSPTDVSIKNITRVFMGINLRGDSNFGEGTYGVWSGVNAGARKLYQKLTAFTGRAASSYSSNDLTILTVSLGSILEQISFIRRLIGTFRLASIRDRSWPKPVLEAQGVNWDAEAPKLAEAIKRFNTLLDRVRGLVIPQNPFLIKCAQMYDYYFTDDATDMSQIIVTMPRLYYMLDETTFDTGSAAMAIQYPNTGAYFAFTTGSYTSLDGYLTKLEQCINALMTSSTMSIVFADLINYAAKNSDLGFLQINNMAYDYVAPVVYSEEFCMQLHNASFFGDYKVGHQYADEENGGTVIADASYDYVYQLGTLQYANRMITQPTAWASTPIGDNVLRQTILDFNEANPSTEKMIEATRYAMCVYSAKIDTDNAFVTDRYTCGDHIILGMTFHSVSDGNDIVRDEPAAGTSGIIHLNCTWGITGDTSNDTKNIKVLRQTVKLLTTLSGYKSAPNVLVNTDRTAALSGSIEDIHGSLAYWKTCDYKYLDVINDRVLQFMFSFI